jgi:hypothetical protein
MANTDIQLDLRNAGAFANAFTIVFWGVRISSVQSVAGVGTMKKRQNIR